MTALSELLASLPVHADEIRLVQLRLGLVTQPLCGDVFVNSRDEAPVYETLSYCWGAPDESCKTILNGIEIDVSSNLYAFLEIRRAHWPVKSIADLESSLGPYATEIGRRNARLPPIWIDALPINQADDAEKSEQVTMMVHIYAKASFLAIWLRLANPEMPFQRTAVEILREASTEHARISEVPIPGHSWALHELMIRPYFSRSWIVQEIAHGTSARPRKYLATVWYGPETVSWLDLWVASDLSQSGSAESSWARRTLDVLERNRADITTWHSVGTPFVELLQQYRRQSASDSRDKVFAFLGLLSSSRLRVMSSRADYTRTTNDIFAYVVKDEIQRIRYKGRADSRFSNTVRDD